MKVGDTYEKYGTKRLVIGIRDDGSVDSTTDLDFLKRPASLPGEESNLKEQCELLEKKLEESEKKNLELEKKLEEFSKNEDLEDHEEKGAEEVKSDKLPDLTCKFCGKVCSSTVGLNAHLKACEKNPDSHNYKE